MIHPRVGDDDKTRLLKRTSDVVSERTGRETTSDSLSASVGGKFQDGTVAVGTGGNDTNIIGVFDSSDDTSSKDKFLPSLANVENMNTCEIQNTCRRMISRLIMRYPTHRQLSFSRRMTPFAYRNF